MNDNMTRTIADIALISTALLFILGLFGIVRWYSFVLPLPIGLGLSIIWNVSKGIYARHRKK